VDNDKPLCEVCNPPLSSVWPNHFGVGYEAAARLAKMMQGRRRKTKIDSCFIPPRGIVTRQSSDVLAVDDPLLIAALQMIRKNACSGISVEDVAREIGASRSVLQRRFRVALGQTVHDHLIAARMKRAIELISNTRLGLGEIAERSGFNYQEYMGAVFRERLGQTPAEYRQESHLS
jgi:LacI family transcriptional regulator